MPCLKILESVSLQKCWSSTEVREVASFRGFNSTYSEPVKSFPSVFELSRN